MNSCQPGPWAELQGDDPGGRGGWVKEQPTPFVERDCPHWWRIVMPTSRAGSSRLERAYFCGRAARAEKKERGSAEISRRGTLGRETTEPEVDGHDSGTEGDPESDVEEGSSRKRRKKKAGSSSDNKKPIELVRCSDCSKTWCPYESSYKTTSVYRRHIESKHPELPCNEASEKVMIQQIRDRLAAEGSAFGLGSAGDMITKKRNRLLEESSSGLLLLKHWLKHTQVNSWEKWGYEDPEVLPQVGVRRATTRSDHDMPEAVDLNTKAELNSSSGLSDFSD
ncbi:hypothetical protein FN846DRAFT_888485 [Sphaerosporella brunnea]|uniref:Uncharacterized protein n=1 Tax=Sphaerosporella brunnea TaxID=1250544 RepID=A0A5J5F2W8_9PEZI|nr:hypothetical protein FN846DRAFT_888485 [Sphaerosporella brunnea]